jgi:hypothetical protein
LNGSAVQIYVLFSFRQIFTPISFGHPHIFSAKVPKKRFIITIMQQPVPFTDDYAISMRQRMSPWRGLAVDDVSAVCAAIVLAGNASKSGSNGLKRIMVLLG